MSEIITEHNYKNKKMSESEDKFIEYLRRYKVLAPVVIIALYTLTAFRHSPEAAPAGWQAIYEKVKDLPTVQFLFLPAIDTVYVLGDSYIVLNLKEQRATLYLRDDSTHRFRISSGTSNLKKGLDTPPGLYTVQEKSPLAISKQFDNAELFSWIGFNGNIGFHGLKGSRYYGSLGIKPSSHGCVRISREDGDLLYKKVRKGTPVLAYFEKPARVLAFAESSDFDPNTGYRLKPTGKSQLKLLNAKLKNIIAGKAYSGNIGSFYLDGLTILRPGGYSLGELRKVPRRQQFPLRSLGSGIGSRGSDFSIP